MTTLTEEQKEQKAKNIIIKLELLNELKSLKEIIDNTFNDAPIKVTETISKEELISIINSIKEGTATNNKIAQFLEIANSLGI
jgi:hypothetical protein